MHDATPFSEKGRAGTGATGAAPGQVEADEPGAPPAERRRGRRELGAGDSSPDGRDESTDERADRNLAELLNELRVAKLGLQVLFGFLLSLPFVSTRLQHLSAPLRALFLTDLVLAAVGIALFTGPVAYHRLLFRWHEKTRVVNASAAMALGGLAAMAVCVSLTVALVVGALDRGVAVAAVPAGVGAVFVVIWLVLPLVGRWRSRRERR